jgi:hypothetical protein
MKFYDWLDEQEANLGAAAAHETVNEEKFVLKDNVAKALKFAKITKFEKVWLDNLGIVWGFTKNKNTYQIGTIRGGGLQKKIKSWSMKGDTVTVKIDKMPLTGPVV